MNKSKKKTTIQNNGVEDVFTPDLQKLRADVVKEELYARYNKASYEKMHYYLECRNLEPIYSKTINEDMEVRIKEMIEARKLETEELTQEDTEYADIEIEEEQPAGV